MTITKYLTKVGSVAACLFTLGASAPALGQVPNVLSLATTPEGSLGYLMSTAYSAGIISRTDASKIVIQTFGGSGNWPILMNRGEVDLGQHCGYEQLKEAYTGTGTFEPAGAQSNIRIIATGFGAPWGIHVVDDSITSIEQLKGKELFIQVSHADHVIALREILAHAGLDYDKDITILPYQSPQEAVRGLLTGRGDGVAYALIPGLAEVQRARGLHTLQLDPEAVANTQAADPVWGKATIAEGRGPLTAPADIPVLEIECGLATGAHLSEDVVYEITKALYESHDEWKGVNPLARQWTPEKATEIRVIPFHDGAIRYFKEVGAWSE